MKNSMLVSKIIAFCLIQTFLNINNICYSASNFADANNRSQNDNLSPKLFISQQVLQQPFSVITPSLGPEYFVVRKLTPFEEFGVLKNFRLSQARKDYRFAAISMGGTKLAVSINNGNNEIVHHAYYEYKDDQRFSSLIPEGKTNPDMREANPDEVMKFTVEKILKTVHDSGEYKFLIDKISANLAGPVDAENGIFGAEFKTPNLPFDNYPFRMKMQAMFADEGMQINLEMCNDCEGAVWGETYSENGLLSDVADGGAFILGTGSNLAVKKDGEIYYGKTGTEIKEVGHNLYQVEKIGSSESHYTFVGRSAKGHHPIERGNTEDEIIRKSGKKGREYLNNPRAFRVNNLGFPIIKWDEGLRDVEDRLSGPSILQRLQNVSIEGEGYTQINLTERALNDDAYAIFMIETIGSELGVALAAFFHIYKDEAFIKNFVLVSGVNENLGKGVYAQATDDVDIYIKSVQEATEKELVEYFKWKPAEAAEVAAGIVRSNITYERELISYQPTDEEVLANLLIREFIEETSDEYLNVVSSHRENLNESESLKVFIDSSI